MCNIYNEMCVQEYKYFAKKVSKNISDSLEIYSDKPNKKTADKFDEFVDSDKEATGKE